LGPDLGKTQGGGGAPRGGAQAGGATGGKKTHRDTNPRARPPFGGAGAFFRNFLGPRSFPGGAAPPQKSEISLCRAPGGGETPHNSRGCFLGNLKQVPSPTPRRLGGGGGGGGGDKAKKDGASAFRRRGGPTTTEAHLGENKKTKNTGNFGLPGPFFAPTWELNPGGGGGIFPTRGGGKKTPNGGMWCSPKKTGPQKKTGPDGQPPGELLWGGNQRFKPRAGGGPDVVHPPKGGGIPGRHPLGDGKGGETTGKNQGGHTGERLKKVGGKRAPRKTRGRLPGGPGGRKGGRA